MAHEIYYTSAPEGLKRGTSGFCTVGATDNIPRALWDRLESLSAFRHHFSANESGGSDRNPASWAHWLLNVAGASYHVLSHVCDSGVDHTHRTNAFAHHVALEPIEMAPAGPAWMLQQNGALASDWDGQVGPIAKRTFPRGDEGPAVCSNWQSLTGDAGWGGALAETAFKAPYRPVAILFAPGQDVLPLIREALRLLPVQNRWNVTFNTYFTSMPTSATCLWRCCLKGTPAADIALRYAQAGLILDITDPARLGRAADSEYVKLARTGQLSSAARIARTPLATTPARAPFKPTPPAKTAPRVPIAPVFPSKPSPPPPVVDMPPPQEDIPFFDEVPAAPDPEQALIDMTMPPGELPAPEYEAPAPRAAESARPRTNEWGDRRLIPASGPEDALREAEEARIRESKKHSKNLMVMYVGAIAAIAIGMLLVYMAYKASIPPEIPLSRPEGLTSNPPDNSHPPIPVPIPQTQEVVPLPPIPVPLPPQTVETTKPNATQVAIAPIPPLPPIPNPLANDALKTIILPVILDRVAGGAGIGDRLQTITLPAEDLANLKNATALTISFPGSRKELPYKHDSLNGTLVTAPDAQPGRGPGLVIRWKDNGNASNNADVAVLTLHRTRAALDVKWKMAVAVRNPEITALVYWVLQGSALTSEMPGGKSQRIEFKPIENKLGLRDNSAGLNFPSTPPKDAVVGVLGNLPQGWTATWYTEWDSKDTALRTPETASQVLKFKRSTSSATVDGWFLLTFSPGFTRVDNNFASRQAADEAKLAGFESDLRAANTEIARIKKEFDRTDASLEANKAVLEATVAAYKIAVNGYKELSDLDVALELPDGARIATMHFRR